MSEMTATRMRPFGRAVTLLALAAAWVLAAWLLWRTTVPSLDLDGLDESRYFGERAVRRAHDYSQGARLIWLLSTAATIATLLVLVRIVPRRSAFALGRIRRAVLIGMLVLATVWLV